MRLASMLLGIAATTAVFTSGCSTQLGNAKIATEGNTDGLLYRNCGCGCSVLIELESDGASGEGTAPTTMDSDVGVTIDLPKRK